MTAKAYSYLRFSTPEQMQGDSFRRQTALAAEYALRHKLALDTKLTFQDLGVSGFRGKNFREGQLGDFLAAVENEQVEKGSYLLLESLDRVSRQKPRKAVKTLEAICEAGINVVTLSDQKVYNEENLDNDPMALIMSVLIFIRANEESETKSRRIKESWVGRRAAARKNPSAIFGSYPIWLTCDESRVFTLVPEKAALVRRIFRLAASGLGIHSIAKKLNQEKVPCLRAGKMWWPSTVSYILTSKTVLGEYQPCITEHVDGKRRNKEAGPPLQLYPPIIDQELFDSAQTSEDNSTRRTRRASTANYFSGLTVCARCGGHIVFNDKSQISKKDGRKLPYLYLLCTNARYGLGCKYSIVRYENVLVSFLDNLDRLLKVRPTGTKEMEAELENLQGPMLALHDRIETLVRGWERVKDPALLEHLNEARGELNKLQEREKALVSSLASTSGPVVLKRIEALREAIEAKDALRANGCMRALFSGLSLDADTGVATLGWKGGGEARFTFDLPREPVVHVRKAVGHR